MRLFPRAVPLPTTALLVGALAGCPSDSDAPPEPILGSWQLHEVELASGQVAAQDAILASYPGCLWGRATYAFDETGEAVEGKAPGTFSVTTDVLCPVGDGPGATEFYGCTVTARVPATWDGAKGLWTVPDGTRARSRTLPMDTAAIQKPTTCEAIIEPGDYPARRIRNEDWRWEVRTPEGTVLRLRSPDTARPDFVTALLEDRARRDAAPAGGAPSPAEPTTTDAAGAAAGAPPTEPAPVAEPAPATAGH